ncbi:MAG: aspartyl-phosphate phosphatase Spo0E family protein [Bacillota bacterium]
MIENRGNRLNLKSEIEDVRRSLHELVASHEPNLLDPKILEVSHQLDRLLAEYQLTKK